MPPMVKPELKAYDVAAGSSQFNAGRFELLNVVTQGDDRFNRQGRKIKMKNLHIRGKIQPTTGGITDLIPDFLRFIILYDKQSNAAVPIPADLIRDSNPAAISSSFSFLNLDNRDRFEILRDISFPTPKVIQANLELLQPLDQIKPSYNVDIFIDLKGKDVMFNGQNSGTISDITTGSLFLYTQCTESVNFNLWDLTYCSRIRYYDA